MPHVTWLVVLSYGGGVLAGGLVGLLSWQVRRRIDDPMLENIAVLVTPFAAFLLADEVHASGVLAVVVCGLLMSQLAPRITGAAARQQTTAFWTLATTVLSSALFVLVGLQAQSAVRGLSSASAGRAVGVRVRRDGRGHRDAVGVGLHDALPDPRGRPAPAAAAAPGRRPAANGHRGRRASAARCRWRPRSPCPARCTPARRSPTAT